MLNTKVIETIQIESDSLNELKIELNRYIKLGYTQDELICRSEDLEDKFPFFVYVKKDEFS